MPLKFEGPAAEHALGFARVHEGYAAIAIVTRLAGRLGAESGLPAPGWQGTYAVVPRNFVLRRTFDVLEGQSGGARELTGRLPLEQVLAECPVALLEVR